MAEYHKYAYKGPVMAFGKLVAENYEAETMAISEKKARSNIAYWYKKEHCKIVGAKITLPGKIVLVE